MSDYIDRLLEERKGNFETKTNLLSKYRRNIRVKRIMEAGPLGQLEAGSCGDKNQRM